MTTESNTLRPAFFRSVTIALSLSYTRRKDFRLCLFCDRIDGQRLTRVSRVREVEIRIPMAGQILCSVENRSSPLQHLNAGVVCCLGAMMPRWAPQTRYTLRRNTASKWTVWFWFGPFCGYIHFAQGRGKKSNKP